MVRFHTALKFIIGHVLAGATIILGTLFVTFVCYLLGLAKAHDSFDTPAAELPFFLSLMFMSGIFAVIASTVSFLISVFLTWLRTKRRFSVWLPIVVVPLLTFIVVLPVFGRTRGLDFVWVATGLAFLYFGIYWTLLTSSGAVLDFLRRIFSRRTTA
jgi:hypothetical protein